MYYSNNTVPHTYIRTYVQYIHTPLQAQESQTRSAAQQAHLAVSLGCEWFQRVVRTGQSREVLCPAQLTAAEGSRAGEEEGGGGAGKGRRMVGEEQGGGGGWQGGSRAGDEQGGGGSRAGGHLCNPAPLCTVHSAIHVRCHCKQFLSLSGVARADSPVSASPSQSPS